ncbi:multidrug and toxin extrusion protein 1 isoform X2 [Plectropomus leopardus]|uniref:multidrug and toxin extrusion protein 1 isoform X2 n=1 Tax=Plectropomus leopardus TaxID=160734 RepID=UPI001C4AA0DA|nr:multidrug and toxin extrusion protein 1 isoform X2 [Plectropomus leopardus]
MEKLDTLDPAHPVPTAGPVTGVSVAKTAGAEGDEAAVAAVSSKLFRCACVRRWVPLVYREELYQVLRLTGPLTFNVTTCSIGHGLALACDTLISQTFGGKNMKRVGVILQRSTLILLLFCLPCWGILINSYHLLMLMHQEDEVARIAQLYATVFLPAVPAMFLHQLQVAYLQNQGIILPQMYTAAAANLLNLGANYVLIVSLELGVVGSAIASSLSQINICLLLFGYIRWKKLHQQTWGGWSTDCLQEWGSYMKLGVPSAFMTCFEWWIWEVGGFLAGALGEVDLAAQHVLLEIGAIIYMFYLGVHAAACVRVGNALGAGNTSRAIVTSKVALVLTAILAVLQGIVLAGCKHILGYIFTSDEAIVETVSKNISVYTFVQFFDALLCVCSGILVGCGMQKIAALSNLVCYYFIGLPVGVALMFAAELRVFGLWVGLLICVVIEAGFFLLIIFRLNWKKVTHKAQLRAGGKVAAIPKTPARTVLNEAMVSEIADSLNTAQLDGEDTPDGYSPVTTQDQEMKAGYEAVNKNTNAGGAEGDAEQSKKTSNTKTQAPLSVTQLILRRGLTLSILVLILGIGVAFHIAYPVPAPSAQSKANFTLNGANDSTPTPLAPLYPTQNF